MGLMNSRWPLSEAGRAIVEASILRVNEQSEERLKGLAKVTSKARNVLVDEGLNTAEAIVVLAFLLEDIMSEDMPEEVQEIIKLMSLVT